MTTYKLKNHIIDSKQKEHKCENCNLTHWLNSPIPIELHHIDGNNKNNEFINLKLLCPNCHALTPNYRGKNKKSVKKDKPIISDDAFIKMIPTCYTNRQVLLELGLVGAGGNYNRLKSIINIHGLSLKKKEISNSAQKRLETIRLKYGSLQIAVKTKITWPQKEELEKLIRENSLSSVGRQLGVSAGAVKKHAKKYGIVVSEINNWCQKHGSRSGI